MGQFYKVKFHPAIAVISEHTIKTAIVSQNCYTITQEFLANFLG